MDFMKVLWDSVKVLCDFTNIVWKCMECPRSLKCVVALSWDVDSFLGTCMGLGCLWDSCGIVCLGANLWDA